MKTIQTLALCAALAVSPMIASTAFAQAKADPASATAMKSSGAMEMADGEIRKVDKGTGKVTIKHGEIKSLAMPPMTMVYEVRQKNMLDTVKAGDKVRFAVVNENGKMIVTEFKAGK